METSKNLIELLDSMPATINVNGELCYLVIEKFNDNDLTYSAKYQASGYLPVEIKVDNAYIYAVSVNKTLEECLIDLKERIKKYI